MLVSISQTRFGHLTVNPVNERRTRRYVNYLRTHGDPRADGTLYLQTDSDIDSLLESIGPANAADVRNGWTVRIRMDEWEYATMLGHDANTIAGG